MRLRLDEVPYKNIIHIQKNQRFNNIYDIELHHVDTLRSLHSVECHIVCYPYNRSISSKNIVFTPFDRQKRRRQLRAVELGDAFDSRRAAWGALRYPFIVFQFKRNLRMGQRYTS